MAYKKRMLDIYLMGFKVDFSRGFWGDFLDLSTDFSGILIWDMNHDDFLGDSMGFLR